MFHQFKYVMVIFILRSLLESAFISILANNLYKVHNIQNTQLIQCFYLMAQPKPEFTIIGRSIYATLKVLQQNLSQTSYLLHS